MFLLTALVGSASADGPADDSIDAPAAHDDSGPAAWGGAGPEGYAGYGPEDGGASPLDYEDGAEAGPDYWDPGDGVHDGGWGPDGSDPYAGGDAEWGDADGGAPPGGSDPSSYDTLGELGQAPSEPMAELLDMEAFPEVPMEEGDLDAECFGPDPFDCDDDWADDEWADDGADVI